jgi:hypothetical protein
VSWNVLALTRTLPHVLPVCLQGDAVQAYRQQVEVAQAEERDREEAERQWLEVRSTNPHALDACCRPCPTNCCCAEHWAPLLPPAPSILLQTFALP